MMIMIMIIMIMIVRLKTENAFNFQNRTVFILSLGCLSFMSRIRSDVWKNFVVQNQITAKCDVPLSVWFPLPTL